VALTGFPMGFALWMSVTNFDGISPTTDYVGFDNYARAFADPDLGKSLRITLLLMLVAVPLAVGIGLGLALLVNTRIRERAIYRALLFLPAIIPVTAGALAFRMVFDQDVGPINGLLSVLHVDVVSWLSGGTAFWVMLAYVLWGAGGSMVLSLAALQGVPADLLEAATVDGAGYLQRLGRIVIPLISPMLLFQIVTGVIAAIQMFVPALLLGNSTVASVSVSDVPEGLRVYMLYVYQTYFGQADFGKASAMLWLLFVIIVAVTALVMAVSRRLVFYSGGTQ
jgi:multiple sugar transport system permease protein